jgi:ATP-dependent DNA helicase RecG
MIVEHPERFGLAQLHQLRGRVGRGGRQSICYLMVKEGLGESARMRLKTLAECTDGFEISLKDLEMRGHGELAGLRQSGAGDIMLDEMLREPLLLKAAKALSQKIISDDPLLERKEHIFLRDIGDATAK